MARKQTFEELRRHLHQLLLEDPRAALAELLRLLALETDEYGTAFNLFGELNDIDRQSLRGTYSNEELRRAYNRVRSSVFDLIAGLKPADFDHKPGAPKPAHQGEVLYRIPRRMPAREETRCVVRIALDRSILTQDGVEDANVIKPLIRVSSVMQVELVDPSANGVFSIRTITEAEQFIDKATATEWIFFVTPLRIGTFPLIIRVSVIEHIFGKERVRQIVLQEQVEILPFIGTARKPEPLKSSGQVVVVAAGMGVIPVAVGDELPGQQRLSEGPKPVKSYNRRGRGLRLTALFLAFILLGCAATWAVAPQEALWVWATMRNTHEAYAGYLEKHPQSRHREKALYRRALLLKTPRAYQEYLQDSLISGEHREVLSLELNKLENEALEAIRARPTAEAVRSFIETYPRSARMKELASIVEGNPALKQQLEQSILNLLGLTAIQVKKEEPQPMSAIDQWPIKMVFVKGGSFKMGDDGDEYEDNPVHTVTVSDFYIGKYEVTQAEWRRVMGKDPYNYSSKDRCDNCPAYAPEFEVFDFIKKLNAQTGLKYRLPTEAEWEFAAQGGTRSKGYRYAGSNDPDKVAWYKINEHAAIQTLHPVGKKAPNELGLYDMTGNADEWCHDYYDFHYYLKSPRVNPKGSPTSIDHNGRVIRGGAYQDYGEALNIRVRHSSLYDDGTDFWPAGFRLVHDP